MMFHKVMLEMQLAEHKRKNWCLKTGVNILIDEIQNSPEEDKDMYESALKDFKKREGNNVVAIEETKQKIDQCLLRR